MTRPAPVTAIPTWAELTRREPRPGDLLMEARRVRDAGGDRFCANAVWYGDEGHPGIKPRLRRLVGWHAAPPDPVLRSAAAYDVVYQTIYDPLPPCRNCGCAWWVA